MEILKQFINNESLVEAVRTALHVTKRQIAADLAEKGEDTSGIQHTSKAIDLMISNLKKEYKVQAVNKADNLPNQGL